MSKSNNAASRNAKGPFRVQIAGFRFGGARKHNLDTVTAARDWAATLGNDAKVAIIYDRHDRAVAKHVNTGEGNWTRAELSN